MNLSLVLPLRNESELSGLLNRLYDPASSDYHHFLSVEEFTERFGPRPRLPGRGRFCPGAWIGRDRSTRESQAVPVSASVAQIEQVLHVRMKPLPSSEGGPELLFARSRAPALDLEVPLAEIAGLDNYFIRAAWRGVGRSRRRPNLHRLRPLWIFSSHDMRVAYYGNGPLTGSGQVFGVFLLGGYAIADTVSTFNGAASSTAFGNDYLLTYTPTPADPPTQYPSSGAAGR